MFFGISKSLSTDQIIYILSFKYFQKLNCIQNIFTTIFKHKPCFVTQTYLWYKIEYFLLIKAYIYYIYIEYIHWKTAAKKTYRSHSVNVLFKSCVIYNSIQL